MAARGVYAKGIAKRDEILTTALEVIAERGFHNTTVRDLAQAVGLSQAGLLHYFGTKEALFIAVLRRRDAELEDAGGEHRAGADDPIAGLIDVGRRNAAVPGLVQLYAQLSTAAAEQGHPAHDYFRERFAQYRARVSELLRTEQAAGRVPASLDPDRFATLLAAVTDGLQTQWMLDGSIDMADHLRSFFEVAGVALEPREA